MSAACMKYRKHRFLFHMLYVVLTFPLEDGEMFTSWPFSYKTTANLLRCFTEWHSFLDMCHHHSLAITPRWS
ncbi:hypothetical protein MPTK1_8g05550 [Marchantia polymorpha subsp. ruderalis]|uniref:Secreted protein n=1 Tax=Marchantia polymorpha TaxID=3197 RepID=A0A2R6WKD9_MARPO|nr:hypothetical protein MARPO_0081s0056 [Marchantia polymorpha]PTQ34331.1 hypothetical protein MARPO_0081s0056 [Marchantia polymorpha]BBN18792.1 hypothetical protein Mp_8g05550 [Marchantia polymorpha subsp. ruderalis]BBN18793.1 hypothetical protein Mp_8g05550 [Marchantia polymorpha subsp. ruderalis]|eukprot:PTQ34330.1 hypothetical protein MARPO_0081s0056 [Marchantia polymorpha]